jgi:hypothetical protein
MKKKYLIFALMTTLFSCSNKSKSETKLLTLSNGIIEIGILPDAGAALVRASLVGKPNILNSDSALWEESTDKRASLDPKMPFKSYKGHITWLSPQSEWWVKQDSFPDLKTARSNWPPDPILTLAPYRIISKTNNQIVLKSPESQYSKVQFTKIFRVDGNMVYLTTQAKNIGSDTISWGLWHNTRMNGCDAVFVKADSGSLLKIDYPNPEIKNPEMRYENGFYSFNNTIPENKDSSYKVKAFINVQSPLIAGNHNDQWLIIRSESLDNKRIHSEQGRVEIYIENSDSRTDDLQELEIQFGYESIAPGESIEASETWEILPGSGLSNKKELLEELKGKLE